jgi:hypothetical protein
MPETSQTAKQNVLPVPRPEPREKARKSLRRKKPLKSLRRKKPLVSSVTVKAGRVRVRRVPDELPAIWHRGIEGTVCVACKERPATDAHHIIRVQTLRREATARGFDFETVRWDTRNRLGLCRRCHGDHHSGKARLTHELLWRYARRVFTFAENLGLECALEREYASPTFGRVKQREEAA